MRLMKASSLVAAAALTAFAWTAVLNTDVARAQAGQETDRKVAGGGITVKGWTGVADTSRESTGLTVNDAKFAPDGAGFMVQTGPGITYWNPANVAKGNYTIKATFDEPKYMNINTHAHPYGIMIAGNDLGTPNQSMLYCSAYGDGRFIVRGFGPAPFQVNGGKGESNAAINKAAGKDQPVKQEIAVAVAGDKVTCSVNGTVVGTYDKAALVVPGRLKSTDGVYGLRFGHNTDVKVTGFGPAK
jgi:hypothetical protein